MPDALSCAEAALKRAEPPAIGHRRDEVQLATKFGIDRSVGDAHRTVCGEAAYVKRSCKASLLRLGVDVIDLYYLHRPPQRAEIEEPRLPRTARRPSWGGELGSGFPGWATSSPGCWRRSGPCA